MNCQSFETIIDDLVREGPIAAELRQQGLSHAETCNQCAMRLRGEMSLSSALRALDRSGQNLQASPVVEDYLIAAFRAAKSQEAFYPQSTFLQPSQGRRFHWSVAAAAAIFAVILGGAGMRLLHQRNPADVISKEGSNESATAPISEDPVRGSDSEVARISSKPSYVPKPVEGGLKGEVRIRSKGRSAAKDMTYAPASESIIEADSASSREIATDFLPVSYSSALSPLESGRIVRVELPRTALASFGLPMNMTQANGSVKADVLIDDYGTARAIRFVR